MKRRLVLSGIAIGILVSISAAAAPSHHPVRRAQKLSHGQKITNLQNVVVHGRPGRPQVVTEIQRAKLRFEVGTARYGWQPRSFR
ncbi:MAG: hypothetical protein H6717_27630 [Polyangiaceae bacterium]|nr:hypothetical protein [Polyangiaceae bacterium]